MEKELKLTAEQEEQCKVVYRKSEKPGEPAIFAGLWRPDAEYSEAHLIVPLRSVFDRTEALLAGQEFVNVISSSCDPKPHGVSAWIDLLRDKNSETGYCCVREGAFHCCRGSNNNMVGGHVLLCPPARDTQARTNPPDPVYLLPICKFHNHYRFTDIMTLYQNTIAIKLKNYMR
jgi:hypothetical protein